MRYSAKTLSRSLLCFAVAALACSFVSTGCGGGNMSYFQSVTGHSLFSSYSGSSGSAQTTDTTGSFFDTGNRTGVDPCSESNARKYVRISMRNTTSESYIHYFLVLVAYVNGETYPDGAVCPQDIDLYTSFGYQEIPEEEAQIIGNLCIEGPALLYLHESGQFRTGGTGGAKLASAIAPAQGTNHTYDNFFTSSGALVPVPNRIYFHNPGAGEGAALLTSWHASNPCSEDSNDLIVNADCDQDSFYYVDETDIPAGTIALGVGSRTRVPSEIQDTGCECLGFQRPYQELAPSGSSASDAACNEFTRGGRIDYAFMREDTNPPFPQLVWRVTDQSGATVHDYDSRSGL